MTDELDQSFRPFGPGPSPVVWILGAGFSAPLGGPMLPELLSLERREDVRAWREDAAEKGPVTDAVYFLFHHGRGGDDGAQPLREHHFPSMRIVQGVGVGGGAVVKPNKLERQWKHAEEFLDALDSAALQPESARAKRLIAKVEGYWKGTMRGLKLSDIAVEARRRVAAECCYFLHDVDLELERWRPHCHWAEHLCEDDTIVTFNYDRVLELLTGRAKSRLEPAGFAGTDCADLEKARADGCASVLKLHGSVDWALAPNAPCSLRDPLFALECTDDELAIATPGALKSKMASSNFASLWQGATRALETARAVIFVGYRFPETDPQALSELLEAIRKNTEQRLDLHIVLGPERTRDVVRLEHLLRYQCRRANRAEWRESEEFNPPEPPSFRIHWHPLFSQDFFAVFAREELFSRQDMSHAPRASGSR